MDVKTVRTFSKQRRRWARGTAKVLFNERRFYAREMSRFSKVGLMGILYLSVDLGIPVSLMGAILLTGSVADILLYKLPVAMVVWIFISTGLAVSDRAIREEGYAGRVIRWSLLNSALYVGVTMPSRFAGLFDTIRYIAVEKGRARVAPPAEPDDRVMAGRGPAKSLEVEREFLPAGR